MAIEDITMQVVSLEKRIVTLEIEDKDDAVFLNGLMSRIAVLENILKVGDPVDWQAECRKLAVANDRLEFEVRKEVFARKASDDILNGLIAENKSLKAENKSLIAVLRSRGYVGL